MAQQIQFRRDTAANWTSVNPILAIGELGLETNTGQFKIGDGVTAWSSLSYGGLVGPAQTKPIMHYGDGSDGDLNLTSGVVTLTRSMAYNNLTISGTGRLVTNGHRVYVKNELDLSNAPEGAIDNSGANGGAALSQTGGTAGATITAAVFGVGTAGGTGATGVVGAGAQAAATVATTPSNGGTSGAGGAGGSGNAGASAAGALRAASTASIPMFIESWRLDFIRGATLMQAGAGGPGGSSGGGDGTLRTQQGGGGGGCGGHIIGIWAKKIRRGASTAVGAIRVNGGDGGSSLGTPAGNAGGGGGGAGGGGGWAAIFCDELLGTVATNMVQANGGNGGTGNNGLGTGIGGNGGGGGNGGYIKIHVLSTSTSTEVFGTVGSAGSAAVGVNGGAGGSGGICQCNC